MRNMYDYEQFYSILAGWELRVIYLSVNCIKKLLMPDSECPGCGHQPLFNESHHGLLAEVAPPAV